jgi:hypothetical protein
MICHLIYTCIQKYAHVLVLHVTYIPRVIHMIRFIYQIQCCSKTNTSNLIYDDGAMITIDMLTIYNEYSEVLCMITNLTDMCLS